jgi:hypothetical protein
VRRARTSQQIDRLATRPGAVSVAEFGCTGSLEFAFESATVPIESAAAIDWIGRARDAVWIFRTLT